MQNCKGIITHTNPHIDEIGAIWLLQKFGAEKYPGIETVEIDFWPAGEKPVDGRSVQEWEEDGYIIIGTAGSRFDEHPSNGEKRVKDECAFTLVAKDLGVDEDPALEKIIKFIKNNDLKGAATPFDIAHISKFLYDQFPDDPQKCIDWVTIGIETKYQEQYQLTVVARKEFDEKAIVEEVDGPNGKLKVVTIESDSDQVSKFARMAGAAIVIQRNSTGHTQIFTNQKFGLRMYDAVQVLRILEQEAAGKKNKLKWRELSAEGKVAGAEEWYYAEKMQLLLNGSKGNREVLPTKLSLEQIQNAVKLGVNPLQFDSDFDPDSCKKGVCNSSGRNTCPIYRFGLSRCRRIRALARNK